MTKLSTVPYAYEPGLIARLDVGLGAVLEAAHAYGGKVTILRNECLCTAVTYL